MIARLLAILDRLVVWTEAWARRSYTPRAQRWLLGIPLAFVAVAGCFSQQMLALLPW